MQLTQVLPVIVVAVVPICLLQWWAMRKAYRKDLDAARARHQSAQQSTDTMLQQARRQYAQIQQELVTLRQALPRPAAAPVKSEAARAEGRARARDGLMNILDEESQTRRSLPVDGFASTLPSQQFALTTSFGSLRAPGGSSNR